MKLFNFFIILIFIYYFYGILDIGVFNSLTLVSATMFSNIYSVLIFYIYTNIYIFITFLLNVFFYFVSDILTQMRLVLFFWNNLKNKFNNWKNKLLRRNSENLENNSGNNLDSGSSMDSGSTFRTWRREQQPTDGDKYTRDWVHDPFKRTRKSSAILEEAERNKQKLLRENQPSGSDAGNTGDQIQPSNSGTGNNGNQPNNSGRGATGEESGGFDGGEE